MRHYIDISKMIADLETITGDTPVRFDEYEISYKDFHIDLDEMTLEVHEPSDIFSDLVTEYALRGFCVAVGLKFIVIHGV